MSKIECRILHRSALYLKTFGAAAAIVHAYMKAVKITRQKQHVRVRTVERHSPPISRIFARSIPIPRDHLKIGVFLEAIAIWGIALIIDGGISL